MSAVAARRYTAEEYLEREYAALEKSEFYRGEIFGMGGASIRHVTIATNLLIALGRRLSPPCRAYGSDLRIATAPDGLYTYPDVSVICGTPQTLDSGRQTATNPTVLLEVLSESTEAYDRGAKFALYREIRTLREYVLVSQNSPTVERFMRQPNEMWLMASAAGLQATVKLDALGIELPLAEIYDGVTFESSALLSRRPAAPP